MIGSKQLCWLYGFSLADEPESLLKNSAQYGVFGYRLVLRVGFTLFVLTVILDGRAKAQESQQNFAVSPAQQLALPIPERPQEPELITRPALPILNDDSDLASLPTEFETSRAVSIPGASVIPSEFQPDTSRVTLAQAQQGSGNSANNPATTNATGDISLRGSGTRAATGSLLLGSTRSGVSRNTVLGSEAHRRPATDAGGLLIQSSSILGVSAQKRNPVSSDVRTRGDYVGQTLASGSYWIPARMDLDTMLNKIDSRIISEMTVIKGPYSALLGPAFDFVDFSLLASPRYEDGFESHGSSSFDFQGNGQRWYGRQSVWGGAENWGIRLSYGHRTGNDYRTGSGGGAGFELPSSYNSRDWDLALGFDLTENSSLEFNLLRLDQTGVEFPGYVYDLDLLITDSYQLTYSLRDQAQFDELEIEGWYNRTRFAGNANRIGKRIQIPELGSFVGRSAFSDADAMSTGASGAFTWDEILGGRLSVGADTRVVSQDLNEITDTATAPAPIILAETGIIPKSSWINPGLFVQHEVALDDMRFTTGGRTDLVTTNVEELGVLGNQFDERNFTLWSLFATAEKDVGDFWTTSAGVGYAERPPTLTELYADSTTISMLQQGLNKLFGNDALNESSRLQVDYGVATEQEFFDAQFNGFYSWNYDYITVRGAAADTFVFTNTDRATLWGVEAAGQIELRKSIGLFGRLAYVEGTDHTFAAAGGRSPLPNIPPLDSRLGIRFRDSVDAPEWQVELSARMVASQIRPATTLLEQRTGGFTVWDLRAFRKLSPDFQVIGGVENLLDRFYREHLDIRSGRGVFQPGVNLYFGSELTY